MKILTLIVARANSKRLRNKNLLKINNKPLIDYTIDFSKKIFELDSILVSTDSNDIRERALKKNVLCPWLRPKKLSRDNSSLVDVSIHAIEWYEKNISKIDGLILLQSSSPFRYKKTFDKGIKLFKKNINNTIITVSPLKKHPIWYFKIKNNFLKLFYNNLKNKINKQSTSLNKTYFPNGNFYIIAKKNLFKNKSFFTNNIKPIIIKSAKESIDIDSIDDLNYAKYLSLKK